MSGKSALIRQTALIVILAQIDLLFGFAKIGIVDKFLRVVLLIICKRSRLLWLK